MKAFCFSPLTLSKQSLRLSCDPQRGTICIIVLFFLAGVYNQLDLDNINSTNGTLMSPENFIELLQQKDKMLEQLEDEITKLQSENEQIKSVLAGSGK